MESLIQPVPLVPEAAALRSGQPGLSEYVERLCTRIDRVDPVVRAFVPEPGRYERLAAEARALADGAPQDRGVLYGVPVGVKDVIQVDGLPTHGGSALPPGVLGGPQATLVSRLRAAGALITGKTVTAEFAVLAPGPTRNPHDLAHTPGGSSSGSAAAVAAGLVPLAVGTQTVGSMIRPAAYCGVVGFRPTYGRIPLDGVIAHAPTLDAVGVFAAEVAGVELAASVLCDDWVRCDDRARRAEAEGPLVFGVPDGPYLDRAEPVARAAFERQLAALAESGLTIRRVPAMADFEDRVRQLRTVMRYELAQVHADWFARFGKLYRPETVAAIRLGHDVDPDDYRAALRAREHFRSELAVTMRDAGLDLWITPAAPGPAPAGLDSTGDAVMSLPWSFAGLPAVGVPAGAVGGLPVGVQLVGPAGGDERLLRSARRVESALGRGPA
ncbi:amidase [Kitasatospora sp. MAP5-34]|uniref:amidase n=1 Tax=Kitasatospora sp. MAP5-34 TaxID=3035102 RepID=UPI0024738F56|nr:amidase [Kitasatospora sp. MAP5-34]MDH6577496.1 Asp-tRNA(Asn)/Glu-tRNA(Gln) amidotransferase A subunit family amidase [Kitasatospora sp. MAP5-34]